MSSGTGAAVAHYGLGETIFLATNATLRPSLCRPLFLLSEIATDETILRDVVIEMPEGCDAASLQSADGISSSYEDVRSRRCSDTYTSSERVQVGVCSAHTRCVESSVAAEQLTGLYCACLDYAYPNPDLAAAYAPYESDNGCLVPRRLNKIERSSSPKVEVLIRKHVTPYEHAELTLDLVGTDGAQITWNITNAATLPTWIHVPNSSAEIPAPLAGQTFDSDHIPITLNAIGRRDQQTYAQLLKFEVTSYLPRRDPPEYVEYGEVSGPHHRSVRPWSRLP